MDISKTGVYVIENLVNGKKYVGSAARSFRERWNTHKCVLRKGSHHSKHLQRAFNKHGEENFKFNILGYYPPCFVLKAEQHFIDVLKPEYNISPTAGNMTGFVHDENSRKKNSEKKKLWFSIPENQKKNSESRKKVANRPEVKEAMRKRSIEFFSIPENRERARQKAIEQFSNPESKAKCSAAQLKRFQREEERVKNRESHSKFIYKILTPDGSITEASSLTHFAKEHKLSDTVLAYTLRGYNNIGATVNQHKGYKILSKTPRQK